MDEDLNNLLNSEPFVPFRVVLTSGTTYSITSPLQLIRLEARITYYFPKSDMKSICRANQLVAIETLPE
jgi:hypothetical protein